MANAYTGTSAMSNLVKAAYDRYVEFALRSQPMFRDLADKRPVQQAMPGSSVVFSLYQDLAAATTALTETVDPDAVALSNPTTVSVTLNEYGNVVLETKKLAEFSFSDVDPAIANIIAYNMADSIDKLVVSTLIGGTNVLYGGDATDTDEVVAADTMTGSLVRKAVAKLRANKAVARKGSLYWCGIHPEVSHDLRAETGSAGWLLPNQYGSSQDRIWAGEIGQYEGCRQGRLLQNQTRASCRNGDSGRSTLSRFRHSRHL